VQREFASRLSDTGSEPVPNILIVDDEVIIAEEIADYLKMKGIASTVAPGAAEALARLHADPGVTVLLTDVRMPGIGGLALARAATEGRGEADALAVVMLTGHASLNDAIGAVKAGAIDFIRKPVKLAELLAVLLRAHDAAAQRRKRARCSERAHALVAAADRDLGMLRQAASDLHARVAMETENAAISDQSRIAFLSIASHELRTPLTPIIGFADLIEHSAQALAEVDLKSYARIIREAGEKLAGVTGALLELSALEAGAVDLRLEIVSPANIMARLAQTWEQAAARAGQSLEVRTDFAGTITTDRVRLLQALGQLLANAIKFSPPGSTVCLSVTGDAGDVRFAVTDQGPGMTETEVEAAMQPFRQLDMSRTRQHGGLGIGLALTRRLADRLGGALQVGPAPEGGTVAVVRLPSAPYRAQD
jgi:signal transduction histidine kinase